jgi:20S proteasome subunit beta 2
VAEVTPSEKVLSRDMGGFCFDNFRRNAALERAGAKPKRAMKTGTTIVGVIYNGGVVLGADTRATEDTVVADKNCEKIHYIAPNIYCCGAGTAADTENVTGLISGQLELLRRSTGRQSRVVTAMTVLKRRLFQYQGHIGAALVLGGVDATGPHLYTIYPHGSTDKLPFVTMGSGSLAAMSVFETGYKDDLTEEEAKELVKNAIRAGIFNDLGSGSNVDLTIIRTDSSVEVLRGYETPNDAAPLRASIARPPKFTIPPGATRVIAETFRRHVEVVTEVTPAAGGGEAMALDD